ncbi:MAG: hypothetical protein OYL92_12420 [Acidobacteriota bacterium]|nr:hypothetical protein [Acidobacteriota bacterium]MDE2922000.1 hypothetical protein [Acidobacteriota bacterium]MDE3265764.1 hypothetical protein [Acidobacteriota bacterium]
MLLVLLPGELPTREFKGLDATLWPFLGAADSLDQERQGLGVQEEFPQTPVSCLVDEPISLVDEVTRSDNSLHVVEGQRVKTQHREFAARGDCLQPSPIVRSQPVRLSARQSEARLSQRAEPGADPVEGGSAVIAAGPNLVQTIDEQSPTVPLGMVEGNEVSGVDYLVGGTRRVLSLSVERYRLPGTRIAEQDVRGSTTVLGKRS